MGLSSSSFKTIKRRADKNVLIGRPINIPVVQYHSVNQGNKLICFIFCICLSTATGGKHPGPDNIFPAHIYQIFDLIFIERSIDLGNYRNKPAN